VRALRVGPPIAWGVATVVMLVVAGIPTSRDLLFSWLLLGMLAFTATDFRRRLPRLVVDWAPLIGILLVYDILRGYADGLVFPAHELPQIRLEEWLFGQPVPTVWLQEHLWHGANDLQWWDYLTWFVYLTHFLATLICAAALWVFAHDKLMDEVFAIAGKIAAAPFLSVRHAKALVRRYWDHNKSVEGAQMELESVMEITRTADCREGIRAFLDKRSPQYRGPAYG